MNSNFFRQFRRGVQFFLGHFGYEVRRKCASPSDWIKRLPEVDGIFDIGIADGTPDLWSAFPRSALVLIDPLIESWDRVQNRFGDTLRPRSVRFIDVAIGEERSQSTINIDKALSLTSFLVRTKNVSPPNIVETRDVEVKPLDDLYHLTDNWSSWGIKIDTEGFELPVLRGAGRVLADATWVIVEVSIIERFENSCGFEDVITIMRDAGFKLALVVKANPGRRGLITNMDLAFVKKGISIDVEW